VHTVEDRERAEPLMNADRGQNRCRSGLHP
jgi:hypothetical protein